MGHSIIGNTNNTGAIVKCHCSPVDHCPHLTSVCFSSTGCFHSVHLDPAIQYAEEEVFGCFANNTNQIDLHCRDPPFSNPLVFCCSVSDGDFCNKNLAPNIPRGKVAGFIASLKPNSWVLLIILPLITLLLGLFSIWLFWHCVLRVRLKRIVAPPDCAFFLGSKLQEMSYICLLLRKLHFRPKCLQSRQKSTVASDFIEEHFPLSRVNKTSRDLLSFTSGSGSGQPFLVHRTVARHIRLIACIGSGRFGEVWRAVCQGETVAVKIFSSRDEASWARETEVYSTGMLNHPNLLAYYASDIISRGGCTQLWLITDYHANGSLYDYLNVKTLTLQECLHLTRSIAAGLVFLHTEVRGIQVKPAIAHRDIKSKNVLVRDDGEACLADLGLALVDSKPTMLSDNTCSESSAYGVCANGVTVSDSAHLGLSGPSSLGPHQPAGPRVGTKRYMAPELLMAIDSSRRCLGHPIDTSSDWSEEEFAIPGVPYLPFEVYQAADIYAVALVLWEIMRCTHGFDSSSTDVEGYEIPYQNMVPTDPTFSQMRSVVCARLTSGVQIDDCSGQHSGFCAENSQVECRPPISPRWLADRYLRRMASLVQECWNDDWSSRLSALRIRKNLEQLEISLAAELESKTT